MIGYPNKKSIPVSHQVRDNYMGRGMSLEDDLNKSNEYYLEIERAVIHKKPIPVQIVRVDYPQRSAAKIVEAYYKTPSTTDYNGIYHGGIGFVIIRFCAYDETYLVDAQYMIQRYQQNESKSIPYAELKDNGFLIKRGFTPRLHYLDVVDQCYFKEEA